MNTIKGVARIALVLAIIAIVPGFLGGWNIYEVEKTMKVRWYGDKKLPAEKIPEEFQKKIAEKLPEKLQKKIKEKGTVLNPEELDKWYEAKATILPPVRYYYPPDWQCAIAGVIGSIVAFLIVFFGISGITRVSLWIAEGFKERK
jgi:hypothetical protein